MEAHLDINPLQSTRYDVEGMHKTDIIEWKKKRKLHIDQFDLHRPKHKCWIRNSENDSVFDESERMFARSIKDGIGSAGLLDDRSELESAKDSNSLIEESNSNSNTNTTMSIDKEGKHEADSAETFQSTCFSDSYNVKDNNDSFDESTVEKVCSYEKEEFVDKECNLSYCADLHGLDYLEDHFLGLRGHTDQMYSEYVKDEDLVDKDFEDDLGPKGENPNKFVLSSGRWNVDQEVESNSRPPTIDEEFEQYFSMLML